MDLGVMGGVKVWVEGKQYDLQVVGREGYMKNLLKKVNEKGEKRNIIIVKGMIVKFMEIMFVVMK